MQFWIEIKSGFNKYRYLVEHKPVDNRTEHFILHAKSTTLTFSCNRPYYQSHPGLKKRAPKFELVKGDFNNVSFLEKITDAISDSFDQIPIVYTPNGKAN